MDWNKNLLQIPDASPTINVTNNRSNMKRNYILTESNNQNQSARIKEGLIFTKKITQKHTDCN